MTWMHHETEKLRSCLVWGTSMKSSRNDWSS
jgi:hypothetical protein